VLFCGTFRGGGIEVDVTDDGIRIECEGRYAKFVEHVDAVTFSAERAREQGQRVFYITERAVFRLGATGVELVEIAPGVDLERDVLDQMGFSPVLHGRPVLMDARLFRPGPMGLVLPPGERRHVSRRSQ